jgi:hypothetical protein
MKKISFSRLVGGILAPKETSQQMWRPADGRYPRLMGFDANTAGLAKQSGLYAVWHLGVRPQWLRVGVAPDLAMSFAALAQEAWVVTHEKNAGIFLAWALVPEAQGAGFARFLVETLKPAFQAAPAAGERQWDMSVQAVPCPLPPGTRP